MRLLGCHSEHSLVSLETLSRFFFHFQPKCEKSRENISGQWKRFFFQIIQIFPGEMLNFLLHPSVLCPYRFYWVAVPIENKFELLEPITLPSERERVCVWEHAIESKKDAKGAFGERKESIIEYIDLIHFERRPITRSTISTERILDKNNNSNINK